LSQGYDPRTRSTIIEIDIGYPKVVSVKLDMALLKEIDELCRQLNYRSRSEFIREALRLYVNLLKLKGREGVKNLFKQI